MTRNKKISSNDFTATFTKWDGEMFEGKGETPWEAFQALRAEMDDSYEDGIPEDPADCDWTGPDGNPAVVERITAWAVDGEDFGSEPDETTIDAEPGPVETDEVTDDYREGYRAGWIHAIDEAWSKICAEAVNWSDIEPPIPEDRY